MPQPVIIPETVLRFLCISPGLPGQLDPVASGFAAITGNHVYLATLQWRPDAHVPGVSKLLIKKGQPAGPDKTDSAYGQTWTQALKMRANALATFRAARDSGFIPDLILCQAGSGLALHIQPVFPQAKIVAYADPAIQSPAPAADIQNLQFACADACFIRFQEQRGLLAPALRYYARYLPMFVDTDFFRPAGRPKPGRLLFFSFGMDERKLLETWRLALALGKTGASICIICGARREHQLLAASRERLDPELARPIDIHYRMSDASFRDIITEASLALFPGVCQRNFHILLEIMSCACPVMASSVFSFPRPGDNILELPESGIEAQFEAIRAALAKPQELKRIGASGRKSVLEGHSQAKILPGHIEFLVNLVQACNPAQRTKPV